MNSEIYGQLKRIAATYLKNERPDHTLQPTALVHEAYVRLSTQEQKGWESRAHFLATAATVMRHILVDWGRHKQSSKGGRGLLVPLVEGYDASDTKAALLTDLDDALNRFEKINARQAQIVEMRFFGGMTEEEIASVFGVSVRTVKRDWTIARAWLHQELAHQKQNSAIG